MLDTSQEELRLTIRGLVKAPMFTTVAVLSLAVLLHRMQGVSL